MNGRNVRTLGVLVLLAGGLAFAGCDGSDKPKVEFISQATTGAQTPCAVLASLFPGMGNSGIGTDTVTINGATYTDSAACDPIVTATVDPNTQDIQVNLLWGWIDASHFYANHFFLSLWGPTLGLSSGAKDIVTYQSAANAVDDFRYATGAVECVADTSLGPIPGGVNFTSVGAIGGHVTGSFSNIPLVLNQGNPPCPAATVTGAFDVIREADDMDSGSGSVASPIALTIGTPVSGALTGGANQSGDAFYSFIPLATSRTISVTGATVDVNWQLYSDANFVAPIAGCNAVNGIGDETCTAGGLSSGATYYLNVSTNNSGPGTSASSTFSVLVN